MSKTSIMVQPHIETNTCTTINTTTKKTTRLEEIYILSHARFFAFEDPGNSSSYRPDPSSRSGASLSASLGVCWFPPDNFFISDLLSFSHLSSALSTILFFFFRMGTGEPRGRGEGGAEGAGGRCDEGVRGRTTSCLDSSPGPTIGDTIADVCLSQLETSRSSE